MSRFLPVAAAAALFPALPAFADTWYVAPCGQDFWAGVDPGCVAPLGPKRTVQAAIDVASDGDEILLLPGVYLGGFDTDGKAVHIRGLGGADATFVNALGGGRVVTCNSLEGADTIIESLTLTGGFIDGDGAGVFCALSAPTFIDCRITGNVATGAGGGVATTLASPTFDGCMIDQNAALGGGGMHIGNGGTVFVTNTFISENTASAFGGGIQVVEASLVMVGAGLSENAALSAAGLASFDGSIEISNASVLGNQATASTGGLAFLGGTGSLTACSIRSNDTGGNGGGITVANGADVDITTSFIATNQATDANGMGGGLHVQGGQVDLLDVHFDGNSAHALGGGIAVTDTGSVYATDCLVENHFLLDGGGGGIGVDGAAASVSLVDTTLLLNEADDGVGGGLLVQSGAATVSGGAINGNEAMIGGGLAVVGGRLEAAGTSVIANDALNRGGGVSIEGTAAGDVLLEDVVVRENTSGIWGGGVSMVGGEATVRTSTIEENSAVTGGGAFASTFGAPTVLFLDACTVRSNTAGGTDGGGIAAGGELVRVDVRDCRVLENFATETGGGAAVAAGAVVQVVGGSMLDNDAQFGGGVSALGGGQFRAANLVVTGNEATTLGGAFHVFDDGSLWAVNCTVTQNTAAGGGAIATEPAASVNVRNTIVRGNFGGELAGVAPLDIRYSIVPAGFVGVRTVDADPIFVDAIAGDWSLAASSPGVDEGLNWFLPNDVLDSDFDGIVAERLSVDRHGNPRVMSDAPGCGGLGRVDIGAHEVAGQPFDVLLADLDDDGVTSFADLLLLLAAWDDQPSCPLADVDGDGTVSFNDLVILLANWS